MSTQHRIWVLKLVANVNRTAKAPKGASSSCAWTAVTLIKAQFIQQLRQDTAGSRTRQKEPLPHPRSGHLSDSEQSLRHFPTFQEEFSPCPRGGLREHLQIQREDSCRQEAVLLRKHTVRPLQTICWLPGRHNAVLWAHSWVRRLSTDSSLLQDRTAP